MRRRVDSSASSPVSASAQTPPRVRRSRFAPRSETPSVGPSQPPQLGPRRVRRPRPYAWCRAPCSNRRAGASSRPRRPAAVRCWQSASRAAAEGSSSHVRSQTRLRASSRSGSSRASGSASASRCRSPTSTIRCSRSKRLRDHLDVLEGRLARQEHDLRGASEDVARGIDVQVRRAHGQVRRLNVHLDGIRFGSIAGIRVEMRRIERMEQILRALRDGDAQELLFMPSIPIEEALDEIFRRYGGGRGGGQRLLDYREYVELVVEIRRQSGETWEPASPSRAVDRRGDRRRRRVDDGRADRVGARLRTCCARDAPWQPALSVSRRGESPVARQPRRAVRAMSARSTYSS